MALGAVHDLEENFPLARQAHAALCEGLLQAARALVCVYSLAGGDSMCGCGHDSVRAAAQLQEIFLRFGQKIPQAL